MRKYNLLRMSTPFVLASAMLVGACNRDADRLGDDTLLGRDLEMAGRDTMTQPALTDVPATTPPATTTPAPRQPAPAATRPAPTTKAPPTTAGGNVATTGPGAAAERVGTIAAGTSINLTSNAKICTNTHRVGQTFQATTSAAVTGSNGVSIPAGATATAVITSIKRSENVNDPIEMGFHVQSVTYGGKTYPLDSRVTDVQVNAEQRSGRDAQKVAGGAAIGAAIGQIIGKDTRSTIIGAATGAAAGTAVAMATGNMEGCIPQGGRITISLNNPVQITVGN